MFRRFLLAACVLGGGLFANSVHAVRIVRGPYLQLQTSDSIVVRWRTDEPTSAKLFFGERHNKLDKRATAAGLRTEHVVQVTGLKPNTRYYYAVGHVKKSTDLLLQKFDSERYFQTAPVIGSSYPTRVWVIGDSGTANKDARNVRDAFVEANNNRQIDVWLMLGDNAYENGKDKEYQKAVFDTYPKLLENTVVWPTLGNHDGRTASSSTQSGVYYDIFTLPTMAQAGGLMSGTEAYYSFDFANTHFVCLDSYDSNRKQDGTMATWLKNDLAATRQEWVVAYFHHPPYTKGSHDSDDKSDSGGRMKEMREWILPVLEEGGVDLVLTGHSHSYERSFLLDGHYGTSDTLERKHILDRGNGRVRSNGAYQKPSGGPVANKGAVYIVAGASGKRSGGKLNHPAMYISINRLGSMVIDVTGKRMDVRYLDDKGKQRDEFTMLKH